MNTDRPQQPPWEPQRPDSAPHEAVYGASHEAPDGAPHEATQGAVSGAPHGDAYGAPHEAVYGGAHGDAYEAPGQWSWQGVPPPGQPVRPSLFGTARRKLAAVGAAAALALGAGGAGAAMTLALANGSTVYASPTAVSGVAAGGTTAQVAAAVQPSVVSIQAQTSSGAATGSGVILRSDGVVLTNAHVVSGAQQVTVKFSDGKTAAAEVLGAVTGDDIAVIKARGVSGLKPATLGDSGRLAVGDQVLAVGSPLGLDGSVTSGIVSALGRQIQEGGSEQQLPPGLRGQLSERQQTVIKNAIQTDAAINPGNSGGALVNSAGQVIGINTAIATSGGGDGNIGVGFAIPIDSAKKTADKIVSAASG
ncbi:S1C family serine protease [Actinomadura chokoriensis]|uniref:Trypsin-like peptidase domain-containing protein n=1 Tax=Actinomadura chokoriensis TaxID=454156 RepID=A0ABV4R782_9ACTN